jgi:hypothetical protein
MYNNVSKPHGLDRVASLRWFYFKNLRFMM